MNRFLKFLIPAFLVVFFAVSYITYNKLTKNNLEALLAGEEPFGIRLALMSDDETQLKLLSQMIFFPSEHYILFYFVNTDAFFPGEEKALYLRNPSNADFFPSVSGIKNHYSMQMTMSSAARLIDILEGVDFFLEQPETFPDAKFQYPQGIVHFSGRQALEYALIRRKQDPGKEYLSGVEQLYRAESILLSLFWNRSEILETVEPLALRSMAFSLLKTDLNLDELISLSEYIGEEKNLHVNVKEIPLELAQKQDAYFRITNYLNVKEKRAKSIVNEFKDDLKSGVVRKEAFAVEVLNGTEINGFARKMKQFIQDRGPLVLDTKNYAFKPVQKTVLIDRSGGTYQGEKLSELTGVKKDMVFFSRSNLEVDISFLIGDDFDPKRVHLRQ